MVHYLHGDLEGAAAAFRRTAEGQLHQGDRANAAHNLCNLAGVLMKAEQLDEARRRLVDAEAMARDFGQDLQNLVAANLGILCLMEGDLPAAEGRLRQASDTALALGRRHLAVDAMCGLAEAEHRLGRSDAARITLDRAAALADELGMLPESELYRTIDRVRGLLDTAPPPTPRS